MWRARTVRALHIDMTFFRFAKKTGTFKVAIKAAYNNCLGNTSLQVNFVALIIFRICVNECACVYLFVCMLLSID